MSLEQRIRSGEDIAIPSELEKWLRSAKGHWYLGKQHFSGAPFTTVNPATEEELSEVYAADAACVEAAVCSARATFESGVWSKLPITDRALWLRKIGDAILEKRGEFAILESLDTGKPIRESYEGDVPRAAANFHFFADLALENKGDAYCSSDTMHYTYREPVGVAALITPWNLPLYLETWKIAPCLLMGNSFVLKPSEWTPLTASYLAELVHSIGLPAGVFNLIHGFGEKAAGQFLVSNPAVNAISFTGETVTGTHIMKSAADSLTKVSFELGGKGASVVFEDADLKQAAIESARAAFRNQGEICLACPRLFVQESVYEDFMALFKEEVAQIKVGNPMNYETTMGALVGEQHYSKVRQFLELLQEPIQVVTGGKRPASMEKGYFLEPTVVTDVPKDHPISQKEVFGPLVSVHRFSTEAEAIERVNETRYGLSASIWTENQSRAYRVSRDIRIGLVWVNCWFVRDLRVPFGGQKASGVGREGGIHSLNFFSEWKSVCVKIKENQNE